LGQSPINMPRITLLRGFGITALLYLLFLLRLPPLPMAEETRNQLLPVIPLWTIVSLGAYCLWDLGWGVATFGDCQGAYEELLRDIVQAKDEMRAKGVSVD